MGIGIARALRAFCWPALLCMTCAANAANSAGPARAFGGVYEIGDVVKLSGVVQLTMTFTLLNPQSVAVNNGVIEILSASPDPLRIGQFAAIESLPQRGRIKVSETFKISAAEYASWQSGHEPRFVFLIPVEGGTTVAGIQTHQLDNLVATGL
jgi:hypothetical protein